MVPPPRLERGTPRSTIWCSNQLSYGGAFSFRFGVPLSKRARRAMVGAQGLEPWTR